MSNLLAARWQMAISLAFHIIFATVGMAMPLMMIIAEYRWIRTGRQVYRELARRWAKGTAILFAVGAVSGTVLSFELGLLWPEFMRYAGPIIGMPFSLEGAAFFLEAIFLGIYIYGWERVPRWIHLTAGVIVLVSGTSSGMLVICANGWMNTPSGFRIVAGQAVDIDPIAAMFNRAALSEGVHMVVAAFQAVGFAVAGIHALMLRRDSSSTFHRQAFAIAFVIAAAASLLQPLVGDWIAKQVAHNQPIKLAALEGQWRTERRAPLRLGGWPDEGQERTQWALELPGGLSFLAHGSFDAQVKGLSEVPRADRPPVAATHLAFQLMVACGVAMAAVALLGGLLWWRRRALPLQPWFLRLVMFCAPLGYLAIEAGWTVTEVGRQPWVIYQVMRTREAVTPMPYLVVPLTLFTSLYLGLSVVVVLLLRGQVFSTAGSRPQTSEGGHGC